MKSVRNFLLLAPLLPVFWTNLLFAQLLDRGPALGVARVSLATGDVTLQRSNSGDSIKARINTPLVEGDLLTTGLASRAEIQLDYSNLLRLNEHSQVRIASLGARSFHLQVEHGIVTYSELRGGEATVEIETPLVTVRNKKNGRYRIEIVDFDEVIIDLQKGQATVVSPIGKETLKKDRRMIVRRTNQEVKLQVVKGKPKDDWDYWNVQRDQQLKKSQAYRYVSRSINGVEDLDGYGRWVQIPSQGRCWFPSVAMDWAPYRYGRWLWLDYYGWTWLSYDSWGWAPYHYGRWFHHTDYGWGWYPGSYYSPHYWRPALVAFFGYTGDSGLRGGIGLTFGHYGWIPLAPGEPFYPWYGRQYRRYRYKQGYRGQHNTILVDNSINVYNTYRNAQHRNGVTLVDARRFSGGKILKARSLQASEFRRVSLMRGQIPVVPNRSSQGQLVRTASSLARHTNIRTDKIFFSRNRSKKNLRRDSFRQQRQDMANLVRTFRLTNNQGSPQPNTQSSVKQRVAPSGPSSQGQVRSSRTVPSRKSSRSTNNSRIRSQLIGPSSKSRIRRAPPVISNPSLSSSRSQSSRSVRSSRTVPSRKSSRK